jgi:hypothetical protein
MIDAGTKATRTVGNGACYAAAASTSEPIHLFSAAGEFTAPNSGGEHPVQFREVDGELRALLNVTIVWTVMRFQGFPPAVGLARLAADAALIVLQLRLRKNQSKE